MAFNYLPNEIKEKILTYASEYKPALKMVSKLWYEIISYGGFDKWISFKDLVRRGDVDILFDLHKRKKKDYDCSLLIYAAFYGCEELCHLAKRWGETNFEGMLYAATKGGHENICRIARAWGAEGIDELGYDVVAVMDYEYLVIIPSIFKDPNFIRMVYGGKNKDLQSIVKEWESDVTILLFSTEDNPKTGNTYVNIHKWEGTRRLLNSKPKDLWSDGGMIIITY